MVQREVPHSEDPAVRARLIMSYDAGTLGSVRGTGLKKAYGRLASGTERFEAACLLLNLLMVVC